MLTGSARGDRRDLDRTRLHRLDRLTYLGDRDRHLVRLGAVESRGPPVHPDEVSFGNHIRVATLSGQDLVFSRVGEGSDGMRVNGMPVQTVHTANNGVIYLIDDIIPFPELEHQLTRNNTM